MKKRIPHLVIFLFVAGAYLLGWFAPIENALMDQRFGVLNFCAFCEVSHQRNVFRDSSQPIV